MRARALVLAAVLAGCAQAPAPPDEVRKLPPLTAYAANPFVPINLYLNANEHLAPDAAALVEYGARRLRDSRAFARVDRGVQRWPITVQAAYRVQAANGSWRTALHLASAVQVHTLVAEIFEEPETIAVVEVTARTAETGPAVMDALLERLLAEIAARKLVPRWSSFKPEQKKKVVPQGRAT
jgi:hypothetical protein